MYNLKIGLVNFLAWLVKILHPMEWVVFVCCFCLRLLVFFGGGGIFFYFFLGGGGLLGVLFYV